MTSRKWRWALLISLATIQVFLFGPSLATLGVFFTPLMKEFRWTHAQVAQLATAVDVSLGACSLLAGWLLDRLDARWVMSTGAVIAGLGFLAAARAHSLPMMVVCYLVIGLGVSMGSLLPTAVVVAHWFPERMALPLGIGHFGLAIGLSLSPRIIAAVVAQSGWRGGMTAIAFPMLLLAAPMSLLLIRTRPVEETAAEAAQAGARTARTEGPRRAEQEIPGLEVGPALRTLPLWLLMGVNFFAQFGLGAVYFHTIPYLLSVGYAIGVATLIFGIKGFFNGPGGLLWGAVSDRFGPKLVIFLGYTLFASSVVLLLIAGTGRYGLAPLLVYMVLWGTDTGAGVAVPVLLAKTQGKRRFGSLNGILGFAASLGQGLGPLVAGVIIDYAGYSPAFEIACAAIFLSALLGAAVYPAKGCDQVPAPIALAKISGS